MKKETDLDIVIRVFEQDIERLESEKLKIEEIIKRRKASLTEYYKMRENQKEIKHCINCGKVLTEEEIEYFDDVCEHCESEIHGELKNEIT